MIIHCNLLVLLTDQPQHLIGLCLYSKSSSFLWNSSESMKVILFCKFSHILFILRLWHLADTHSSLFKLLFFFHSAVPKPFKRGQVISQKSLYSSATHLRGVSVHGLCFSAAHHSLSSVCFIRMWKCSGRAHSLLLRDFWASHHLASARSGKAYRLVKILKFTSHWSGWRWFKLQAWIFKNPVSFPFINWNLKYEE